MSLSPLGLHFGHYRAGTFNPMITVFNARLANLRFTTGYSLTQWRKGLKSCWKSNWAISMWRNFASFCYLKEILIIITSDSGKQ